MKISELSRAAGVPVATIKFYLREGLLPAGRSLSRTQADYDESHLERLRLIRALAGAGGLELSAVARVLRVLDDPATRRLGLLEAAHTSLLEPEELERMRGEGADSEGTDSAGSDSEGSAAAGPDDVTADPHEPSRARRWIRDRGWTVDPEDPLLDRLDAAWESCDDAALGIDEERLDAYADAAEQIARIDVGSVPEDPDAAVRQVVLGTVLVEPVLATLRRLAQQHVARTGPGGDAPREGTDDA